MPVYSFVVGIFFRFFSIILDNIQCYMYNINYKEKKYILRIGDLEGNLLRNFIVGDLMTQSIMEIWNGEPLKKLLYPDREKYLGTLCYNCTDFTRCNEVYGRCFLRSLIAYNTPYAPDPLCRRISNYSIRMV